MIARMAAPPTTRMAAAAMTAFLKVDPSGPVIPGKLGGVRPG
jgi:hypothetical protein